jgi:DNA-binding transcriptional MerR regulator
MFRKHRRLLPGHFPSPLVVSAFQTQVKHCSAEGSSEESESWFLARAIVVTARPLGRGSVATPYRIGAFAELSGVCAKHCALTTTLACWLPASVDPRTGYRFYVPQQLHEIASIIAMKELGVPVAKLRGLMKKTATRRERRDLLAELKRTVEQSIKTATQSLRWVDAPLQELDEAAAPIPVVVKRRPAVFVASIRSKVQTYTEIEQFERELFASLPARSIGDLRGVLWHRCGFRLSGGGSFRLTQSASAIAKYLRFETTAFSDFGLCVFRLGRPQLRACLWGAPQVDEYAWLPPSRAQAGDLPRSTFGNSISAETETRLTP